MSKYARRKDDNHDEIANEFKRLGCGVKDVHNLPDFVDILIVRNGVTVAVEIKDGAKPPSARQLTSGEKKFAEEWQASGGKWACIINTEQVRELVNQMSKGI